MTDIRGARVPLTADNMQMICKGLSLLADTLEGDDLKECLILQQGLMGVVCELALMQSGLVTTEEEDDEEWEVTCEQQ